jgi:hypothetical protein
LLSRYETTPKIIRIRISYETSGKEYPRTETFLHASTEYFMGMKFTIFFIMLPCGIGISISPKSIIQPVKAVKSSPEDFDVFVNEEKSIPKAVKLNEVTIIRNIISNSPAME